MECLSLLLGILIYLNFGILPTTLSFENSNILRPNLSVVRTNQINEILTRRFSYNSENLISGIFQKTEIVPEYGVHLPPETKVETREVVMPVMKYGVYNPIEVKPEKVYLEMKYGVNIPQKPNSIKNINKDKDKNKK